MTKAHAKWSDTLTAFLAQDSSWAAACLSG
jgi:hypothetical protein